MRLLLKIPIVLGVLFLYSCGVSKTPSTNNNTEKNNTSISGKSNASKKVQSVLKEAKKYLGSPYKFGGTSQSGIDCSGLMFQSFKSIDFTLPRTSAEQSKQGIAVKPEDLKIGDLVFFTDRKGNSKVTHVGVVSQVNGPDHIKFIHASTKAGVVEDDFFAPYYRSVYLFARRIL